MYLGTPTPWSGLRPPIAIGASELYTHAMVFHIITTFPGLFASYLGDSILARAIREGKITVEFYNPRDFTTDKHHKTDERPYSGGPGMVMIAEPILLAVQSAISNFQFPTRPNGYSSGRISKNNAKPKVYILSPSGEQFTNVIAAKFAKKQDDVILICGRYEGIDARVKKILRAKEISIGPYVLTGGELPVMAMIDAITRQIPGVLGKDESVEERRVSSSEVYTRPEVLPWKGKNYKVPKVLLSGHTKKIEEWKTREK